jgi:fructose-bisphosphate aldolase class II
MTIVNLKTILDHAQKHQYAVPAFNINFQAQAEAVLQAALETQSPAIIQISSGGMQQIPPWLIAGLLEHIKTLPIPVCIHRDHTYELKQFTQSMQTGWFTSLMMDGSICPNGYPRSFEENVAITQTAIKTLAGTSISIEAELGCLGALESGQSGEEDGHKAQCTLSKSQLLTCPDQAAIFLDLCPVDALAIAIGTSHGAYKFTSPPDMNTLSIQTVKALHTRLPKQHFVLHGCSTVSQDHLKTINQYGGNIPATYGVPIAAICDAIPFGVRKVNIDTDLRLGFTAATRKLLYKSPQTFDPRSILKTAKDEMQSTCIEKFNAFGASKKAPLLMKEIYETT